jgi:hypothetical protein
MFWGRDGNKADDGVSGLNYEYQAKELDSRKALEQRCVIGTLQMKNCFGSNSEWI